MKHALEAEAEVVETEAESTRSNADLTKVLGAFVLIIFPLLLFPSIVLMRAGALAELHQYAFESDPVIDISSLPRTDEVFFSDERPRQMVGYAPVVIETMREMGLSIDAISEWIAEHPSTSLRQLRYMSDEQQSIVANTAVFIRKLNSRVDEKTAWREAAALLYYSGKYGVPWALATAVAQTESTFDPSAVSKKGASGVMQVMWRLHDQLLTANGITSSGGRNPLADPEQAIAAGCLLISRNLRAQGSVTSAMAKYYGGRSEVYQGKIDRSIVNILKHHSSR